MQGNGIGPLVSQLVRERNALRAAGRVRGRDAEASEAPAPKEFKPHPHADTVEISASARARFEALKARLDGAVEEQNELQAPGSDPVGELGGDDGDNGIAVEPALDDGGSGGREIFAGDSLRTMYASVIRTSITYSETRYFSIYV